jgi:hypothetical protein
MAIATAPSVVSTLSYNTRAGVAGGDRAAYSDPGVGPAALTNSAPQNIQSMQRVGSVVVPPNVNATVPLGGRFDVWFDLASYTVFIDTLSTNIGGPA